MKLLSLAILLLSSLPALAQFGAQAVSAGRWEPRNYATSLGLQASYCTYWTNTITLNGAAASEWIDRSFVTGRPENLLLQSEEFDATWSTAGSSVDDQADGGPLGDSTADKLIEDAATSAHYIRQSTPLVAGTYVFEAWAKPSERGFIRFGVGDLSTHYGYCYFNITTGSVGAETHNGSVSSGTGSVVGSAVNGYFLCRYTFTCSAPITSSYVAIYLANNTPTHTYDGDDSLTYGAFIWGASLRSTASSPSSDYVATTTLGQTASRSLAQGTATSQPIWTNTAPWGGYCLYFDGSNDSMSVGVASMVQPTTIYLLHNPATWTLNDAVFDGVADARGKLYQSATTPNIRFSAGSAGTELTPPALGTWRLATTVFDGDNSRLSTNAGPFTVSVGGAGNMAGLRIGANGAGSANWNGQIAGVIVTAGATNSTAATTYLQHGFLKMAGVK